MGMSKTQAIEEANRNEAKEAIAKLEKTMKSLFAAGDYVRAGEIREAIKLIEAFNKKYSAPSAWDLK